MHRQPEDQSLGWARLNPQRRGSEGTKSESPENREEKGKGSAGLREWLCWPALTNIRQALQIALPWDHATEEWAA